MSEDCPSADVFVELLRGQLGEGTAAKLEDHLDTCSACAMLLAELARSPLCQVRAPSRSGGADRSVPELLPRGRVARDLVGRYRIRGEIGRGGMGLVYAAYDPELRRTVALKLLRPRLLDGDGAQRLLAEARALAKLQHPHVVEIYDVGTFADQVFIAMRHVPGVTLGQYARDSSHSVQEVLQRCLEAGRGLLAAHRAGLVHRDFKPSNVLVGTDGRAVVVDFGLAWAADGAASNTLRDTESAAPDPREVVGTPRYMAPEQWRGDPIQSASDQFAYCVSVYECLYGDRPLLGEDTETPAPPAHRPQSRRRQGVPTRIESVLRAGMSPKPRDRHADMAVLLDALARAAAPGRGRRRAAWTLGSVVLGAWMLWPAASKPRCREQAESVWSTGVSQEVRRRFEQTDLALADGAYARLDVALSRFDQHWHRAHARACGRGIGEPRERDRALACLRRHQGVARSLVDVWKTAERDDIMRLADGLDRLPAPNACLDDATSPPTAASDEDRLASAVAIFDAGRFEDGVTALGEVVVDAQRRRDGLRLARAQVELGRMYIRQSRLEEADQALQTGLWWAQAEGDDALVARAFNELAWLDGYLRAELPTARRHVRHAAAAIERLGGDGELEGVRQRNAGWIAVRAGDPQAALEHFEASLAHGCEDCRDRWIAHVDLSTALTELGRFDEAIEHIDQALEGTTERVGRGHPDLAVVRNNLAANYRYQEKFEDALSVYDEIAATFEAAYGPRHAQVGRVALNQATVLADLNRYDEARQRYDAAGSILSEALGREHPELARVHDGRATVFHAQGDEATAIRELERAVAIKEAALGPDHPGLGLTLANLGLIRMDVGQPDVALDDLRRARSLLGDILPADHPHILNIDRAIEELASPGSAGLSTGSVRANPGGNP